MMNAWPIFQPQDSTGDLARHPHRLVLVQSSVGLKYPSLCPHCGTPASRRIVVQKVFCQAYTTKINWDPVKDPAYVLNPTGYAFGLVVPADSPLKSWADFVGYA
jgi:tripartite-type tricarboxylate transporter receptor subunit TctC